MVALALALTGYGYGPDQDPLVEQIKLVAADAHAERWGAARLAFAELEAALAEIDTTFGVDLRPPMDRAIRRRDRDDLARRLTSLAYLAMELKLESCRREKLERYYAAKYRVEAARTYYAELLAPAVRRHDRTHGKAAHEEIWNGFDAARAALGRPGFLGRGVVAADLEAFEAATARIERTIREVFPFLPEGVP